jgi:poly-gamma-glutamate capsule biosynthesis protein CapA/YwtB (metallophosphatase superfamily)
MKYSPRLWVPVCLIAISLLLILPSKPVAAAGNHVVLILGGDVEWALNSRPPTVRYRVVDPRPFGQLVFGKRDVRDQIIDDWPPIPYVNEGESKAYLESLGLKGGTDDSFGESLSYPLPSQAGPEFTQDYSSNQELLGYPLRRLTPTFHAADLVVVNCEGALSDHARQVGLNRTPEKFAKTMRSSGITLVNLANNHTFDAEERGFLDTLRALSSAGIAHVGGGHDLADARKPVILARNGIKLGFLGYAQFNNMGESAFAADGRPGIVPMDPFLIKEDIRRLRPQVDYVVVAIHWATNRKYDISPDNRKFAHDLIDAGADIIMGHHPPHPKGIEVYHGKVILYAPSNILRGHTNMNSDDGYLARFTLGEKSVEKVEVLPIAGKGQPEGRTGQPYDAKLFQPFLMEGSSARQLLEAVRSRSAALDTAMEIDGDKGVITIPPASK